MTRTQHPNDEQRWKAVLSRDTELDGSFVYGVTTTGIYCRPACASRRPAKANARFFDTPADAERAGFRACRRCHPESLSRADAAYERVRRICAYIDAHLDEPLPLTALARRVSLSSTHLQRQFKACLGVSPRQYQEARRVRHFKEQLRNAERDTTVTDAVFEAGFGSLSRLYEKNSTHLGMTPMAYRSGGEGIEISFGFWNTPLGLMLVAATDRGICSVQFGTTRTELTRALQKEYPSASLSPLSDPPPAAFREWMDSLTAHLEGRRVPSELPLHVRATAFQTMVWSYLRTIPSGDVRSYQEVADAIGHRSATRAVARACATNPVALIIPCHRVIRASGELGGYRWGLERKRTLIDLERAHARSGAPTGEESRAGDRGAGRQPRRTVS